MSRYARRTDDNQTEIIRALRARGHLVQSLAGCARGVPDLLVGRVRGWRLEGSTISLRAPGVFVLLEVKDGRKQLARRRLSPLELAWHEAFKGFPVAAVECAEDAIAFVEAQ